MLGFVHVRAPDTAIGIAFFPELDAPTRMQKYAAAIRPPRLNGRKVVTIAGTAAALVTAGNDLNRNAGARDGRRKSNRSNRSNFRPVTVVTGQHFKHIIGLAW